MPLLAVGLRTALILTEGELARSLLDPGAVHRFDPPAAGEDGDPLGCRVLMPFADPADRLHRKDHGRFAACLPIVPLRRCVADAQHPYRYDRSDR